MGKILHRTSKRKQNYTQVEKITENEIISMQKKIKNN